MSEDGITINTSEFDGLAELLTRFPDDIQKTLVRNSLKAGAQVMQVAVIQKCPMRQSVLTAHGTGAKAAWLKGDIRIAQMKNGGWRIGAGTLMAYLLRWLERGHLLVKGGHLDSRNRAKGKTRIIGHVPAYPVLRPAFDESVQTAVHAIAVELQSQMSDYWNKTLRVLKRAA